MARIGTTKQSILEVASFAVRKAEEVFCHGHNLDMLNGSISTSLSPSAQTQLGKSR